MLKLNFSILVVISVHVTALVHDNAFTVSDVDPKESKIDIFEQKLVESEIEKRKEIVKNYLDSRARVKETGTDPNDIIVNPVDEISSDSNVNPSFSDISSEILNPNSMTTDDSEDANEVSGTLFSNKRQDVCVLDSIYISRWLKKMISKIEEYSELEPMFLNIPLNSGSVADLKVMSNVKCVVINDLDELVFKLISQATVIRKETFDWSILTNYLAIFIKVFISALPCLVFLWVIYNGFRTHPLKTSIICFFLVNIIWHWMHLYQKKIAEKHSVLSMDIPIECQKSEFGLLEHIEAYIKSFFHTSDCTKYFEALMVNPIWEVSLSVAFVEALTCIVFQPLYFGSKALNDFVKLLTKGLSVFQCLIIFTIIFLILIMFFKYKVKLPFFMGSLEPSDVRHSCVEEVKSLIKSNMVKNSENNAPIRQSSKEDLIPGRNRLNKRESVSNLNYSKILSLKGVKTSEERCDACAPSNEEFKLSADKSAFKNISTEKVKSTHPERESEETEHIEHKIFCHSENKIYSMYSNGEEELGHSHHNIDCKDERIDNICAVCDCNKEKIMCDDT